MRGTRVPPAGSPCGLHPVQGCGRARPLTPPAARVCSRRREVERRLHPLAKADFALLAAELDAWRLQQTAAIKAAGLAPQEQQAALQLLLAKETRLLQMLDRLRVNARHEHTAAATQQQLSGLAAPKTWQLSNGKAVRTRLHRRPSARAAAACCFSPPPVPPARRLAAPRCWCTRR